VEGTAGVTGIDATVTDATCFTVTIDVTVTIGSTVTDAVAIADGITVTAPA